MNHATKSSENRKIEILEKALEVFVEEGYADTTFQKIAERCGITRTILYVYFRNKRDIFAFSVKHFMDNLEARIMAIAGKGATSQADKIADIMCAITDTCAAQRRLLSVVLSYILVLRESGANAEKSVLRRIIRMRHIISKILIDGQKTGEFGSFDVAPATDLVFALVEAVIYRIALLGKIDAGGLELDAAFLANALRSYGRPRNPGIEVRREDSPAGTRSKHKNTYEAS